MPVLGEDDRDTARTATINGLSHRLGDWPAHGSEVLLHVYDQQSQTRRIESGRGSSEGFDRSLPSLQGCQTMCYHPCTSSRVLGVILLFHR